MTKNNLKVVKSTKDQEMDVKEKNKALDAAIAQITDNFGKGSVMKLGEKRAMDIESVSTGSLSLDLALGIGGLPKGRIIEVYGPESSGKTTLALQVVAEAQKSGGICAFVDAEHALATFVSFVLTASSKSNLFLAVKFEFLLIVDLFFPTE